MPLERRNEARPADGHGEPAPAAAEVRSGGACRLRRPSPRARWPRWRWRASQAAEAAASGAEAAAAAEAGAGAAEAAGAGILATAGEAGRRPLRRSRPPRGVGSDSRGVGRRAHEGRVGRQDRGQLAGRDAGDFGGPPIVQDVPGDGRLE